MFLKQSRFDHWRPLSNDFRPYLTFGHIISYANTAIRLLFWIILKKPTLYLVSQWVFNELRFNLSNFGWKVTKTVIFYAKKYDLLLESGKNWVISPRKNKYFIISHWINGFIWEIQSKIKQNSKNHDFFHKNWNKSIFITIFWMLSTEKLP